MCLRRRQTNSGGGLARSRACLTGGLAPRHRADLVADGGVVVNTTVWMPAPSDEARGVRGIDLYVRSDAQQLAELVGRIDRGELVVDVAERVVLEDLASVHARAAAGTLTGKVGVIPRG